MNSESYQTVVNEHAMIRSALSEVKVKSLEPFAIPLTSQWKFFCITRGIQFIPAFLRKDWTSMLLVKAGNDTKHSQLHSYSLALLNVIFTSKGCLGNEYSFPALLPLVEVLVLMLNVLSFLGEKLLCWQRRRGCDG